ncbi:MAG: hypothetical protein IJ064_03705 [Bacteroidaceae bacterium]|nr:hypothetical protein [Bacteroidaceae bacterium]
MKKSILILFLLVLYTPILVVFAESHELITKHLSRSADGKWTVFIANLRYPMQSPNLEKECCLWLFQDSTSNTLREAVGKLESAYVESRPIPKRIRIWETDDSLSMLNDDEIGLSAYELSMGLQAGQCQSYYMKREEKVDGKIYYWSQSFIYDSRLEKILTVDDIFVPSVADSLKARANLNAISMHISRSRFAESLPQDEIKIQIDDDPIITISKDILQCSDEFTEDFKISTQIQERFEAAVKSMREAAINEDRKRFEGVIKDWEEAQTMPPKEKEKIKKLVVKMTPKIEKKLRDLIAKDYEEEIGEGLKYANVDEFVDNRQWLPNYAEKLLEMTVPRDYHTHFPKLLISTDDEGNISDVTTTLPWHVKNIAIMKSLPHWYTCKAYRKGKTSRWVWKLIIDDWDRYYYLNEWNRRYYYLNESFEDYYPQMDELITDKMMAYKEPTFADDILLPKSTKGEGKEKVAALRDSVNGNPIVVIPEENAEFPGDVNAWLNNNLKYPRYCSQMNIQGRVSVQFTIAEDGQL